MGMAERIKERRIAMGFTQEELASKLGLQKSAIAKYENGRVENIKRSVIIEMAKCLDCSPSYLMGWDEPSFLEIFSGGVSINRNYKLLHTETENNSKEYYINPKTKEIAQEIYENKELSLLFDAARDAEPEDLQTVHTMLMALKKKELGED